MTERDKQRDPRSHPPLPYQHRFMGGYHSPSQEEEIEADNPVIGIDLAKGLDHSAHITQKREAPVEEMETLPNGAKQSKLAERFDLIDPGAIKNLAQVLAYGAEKYGDSNWKSNGGIPLKSHLNHLVRHVYKFLEGDTSEDHLGHVFCRAMMAIWAKNLVESMFDRNNQE